MEMDGAELMLGVGKETLDEWSQTGEVIGNEEQAACEAAVFEIEQDLFPAFQLFSAPESSGGEDFLFSGRAVADDQEMNGGPDVVLIIFKVDVFGVDEEEVPVGRQRTGVEVFGFEVEIAQELFELSGGVGQAEVLEGAHRGFEALGLEEDVFEQLLVGVREVALMFGQGGGVEAGAGAGQLEGDGSQPDVESALRAEAISAIVGTGLEVELTFLEQGGMEQIGEASVKERLEILGIKQRSQDGVVGELGNELMDARLQRAGDWVRAHMGREEGKERSGWFWLSFSSICFLGVVSIFPRSDTKIFLLPTQNRVGK